MALTTCRPQSRTPRVDERLAPLREQRGDLMITNRVCSHSSLPRVAMAACPASRRRKAARGGVDLIIQNHFRILHVLRLVHGRSGSANEVVVHVTERRIVHVRNAAAIALEASRAPRVVERKRNVPMTRRRVRMRRADLRSDAGRHLLVVNQDIGKRLVISHIFWHARPDCGLARGKAMWLVGLLADAGQLVELRGQRLALRHGLATRRDDGSHARGLEKNNLDAESNGAVRA